MSPTIQRLAASLETAVYGWMGLVADRDKRDDAAGDDPLASPLALPSCEEPVRQAGSPWSQAS